MPGYMVYIYMDFGDFLAVCYCCLNCLSLTLTLTWLSAKTLPKYSN